jgi:hypothetical protein
MKKLTATLLFYIIFHPSIGQVNDSTIVVLDPFEVKFESKLLGDVQNYVNESRKILNRFFVDSLTENASPKEALLISRLKKYQSNFDVSTAFSFFYVTYLNSKLEGRYEVVPIRLKSTRDIKELKKVADENNSRWIINISNLEFYINDNEEFSTSPNGKKGRIKIELFDSKTNSIELTQEIDGDSSGIDWFLPCDSGKFKCIMNHLIGDSTYEFADYFKIE